VCVRVCVLVSQDGAIYNFLSAKNVTMNVRIASADFHWRQRLVHGTKMASASWVVRTHKGALVYVAHAASKSTAASRATVRVEYPHVAGSSEWVEHTVTATEPVRVDEVTVSLDAARTLTVDTGRWLMTAAISPFPFGKLNPEQVLLDVKAEPKYDADHDVVAPHGLLGQSFDGDSIAVDGAVDHVVEGQSEMTTAAQGEGAIEGHINDYTMKDPFATHFKFSRFDLHAAKPRDVTKLTGIKRARNATAGASATDLVA